VGEIELFQDSALSPQKRAIIEEAFEAAWAEVESRFIGEEDRKYARTKLAGIVRMIARQKIVSPQLLTDTALAVFNRQSD
jgi:hypothetical protein